MISTPSASTRPTASERYRRRRNTPGSLRKVLAALAVAYQVQCRLSDAAPDRAPLDSGVKAVKNLEKISVRNLAMHLV